MFFPRRFTRHLERLLASPLLSFFQLVLFWNEKLVCCFGSVSMIEGVLFRLCLQRSFLWPYCGKISRNYSLIVSFFLSGLLLTLWPLLLMFVCAMKATLPSCQPLMTKVPLSRWPFVVLVVVYGVSGLVKLIAAGLTSLLRYSSLTRKHDSISQRSFQEGQKRPYN